MRVLLLLVTVLLSVNATAECYISVGLCPTNLQIKRNTYFLDSADGAAIDSNRCLQRAREYHSDRAVPPHLSASAFFFTSAGVPVIGIIVGGVGEASSQLYCNGRRERPLDSADS